MHTGRRDPWLRAVGTLRDGLSEPSHPSDARCPPRLGRVHARVLVDLMLDSLGQLPLSTPASCPRP